MNMHATCTVVINGDKGHTNHLLEIGNINDGYKHSVLLHSCL